MNKKIYKLAASLVCANMLSLEQEIKELELSKIDYIHFDVMDGNFVPRLGLHPEMLKAIKSITKLPVDVHMMVNDPERYVDDFAKAGADIIVVHAEATKHLHRAIQAIKQQDVKAGVALNMATPLNVLDYVLNDISVVMLMAINPGIVGHKLIPEALDKIRDLKSKLTNYPDISIMIDGGVNPDSAPQMIKSGADILVCGTSMIFQPPAKISDKIKEVRENLNNQL